MKQLALVLALAGTCVLGSTLAATPASALETYEAKMAASDAAAQARIDEDAATAALTVTRQGDRTGTATVSYTTADGTAKAGQDYAAKTGTVTFAPGETTKQITIAISADTVKESDESFSVALSNASGAALAAPRTETVTIQDLSLIHI